MNLTHKFPANYFDAESMEIVVGTKTKKHWAILLDMLLSLDELCKKHGIKYFLDGGSLLGAIRHKGFIPWDNDVDVIMLREEYEKLCRVASEAFKPPFFFQTAYTDVASARRHAQVRRSDTTAILKREMVGDKPCYVFNQGVFLDIFVLDAVPDDPDELESFRSLLEADIRRMDYLRWRLYARDVGDVDVLHPGTARRYLQAKWYKFKKRALGVDVFLNAYRRFEADVTRYKGRGMRRVANVSLNPRLKESHIFDRSIFEKSALYTFEGHAFPGPADYETVLRGYYGNWHEHVVGADGHGGIFLDLEKPYAAYLEKS